MMENPPERPLSLDELRIITEMLKQSMNDQAPSSQQLFDAINDISSCPVCGSGVERFGAYALEFGSNVRKKASFCGLDCLNEFINELNFSKGLPRKDF